MGLVPWKVSSEFSHVGTLAVCSLCPGLQTLLHSWMRSMHLAGIGLPIPADSCILFSCTQYAGFTETLRKGSFKSLLWKDIKVAYCKET